MKATLWMIVAVLLLPAGVAYAQDYERVERSLGAMVAKGEITLEQAKVMMDALKRMGRKGDGKQEKSGGKKKGITPEEYKKTEAELKRMVKAGEISEAEAKKKLEWMRKNMAEARLKKMVQEGKITEEQARKKLELMRKGKKDSEAETLRKRLERAVKEGHLTEEEAREKWRRVMEERKSR